MVVHALQEGEELTITYGKIWFEDQSLAKLARMRMILFTITWMTLTAFWRPWLYRGPYPDA